MINMRIWKFIKDTLDEETTVLQDTNKEKETEKNHQERNKQEKINKNNLSTEETFSKDSKQKNEADTLEPNELIEKQQNDSNKSSRNNCQPSLKRVPLQGDNNEKEETSVNLSENSLSHSLQINNQSKIENNPQSNLEVDNNFKETSGQNQQKIPSEKQKVAKNNNSKQNSLENTLEDNQRENNNISEETKNAKKKSPEKFDIQKNIDTSSLENSNELQQLSPSQQQLAKSSQEEKDTKENNSQESSKTINKDLSESASNCTKNSQSNEDNLDKQKSNFNEGLESSIDKQIVKNNKLTLEEKKALLEKLKKSIEEIRLRKQLKLQKKHLNSKKQELKESQEEKYQLTEETNNFLNQLETLPSFEERNRGAGYSIDTGTYTTISESIIRTLITKFLNQRFCKQSTDLNVRSNSLEKTAGFYKWQVKDVIIHLETNQVTKVLTDKYGYQYAQGKSENVPLSFYFDMSGSMSSYTNMLAVIAIELLKKGVKVLIGFNERVNVQIDSIEKNITVKELAEILESAAYYNYWDNSGRKKYKVDARVRSEYIEKNIDNYLIDKKAEKCVVFADFDPKEEIINLSHSANVYWFCFEKNYDYSTLEDFNGFIYNVQSTADLEAGLLKVNTKKFETLCYTENPKKLQKKVRVKK